MNSSLKVAVTVWPCKEKKRWYKSDLLFPSCPHTNTQRKNNVGTATVCVCRPDTIIIFIDFWIVLER